MAEGPLKGASSAPRWIDMFPWISAAASRTETTARESQPWWFEPVDASGTPERRTRLDYLSDLALERLTRWTLGQIFPMMPHAMAIASLPFTNRAKNALNRFGYQTAGDLQGVELGDLFDLPNVGAGSVDSIIKVLADASARATQPIPLDWDEKEEAHSYRSAGANDQPGEPYEGMQHIIDDLHAVAAWYAVLGRPTQPLLADRMPAGSPPEVVKARQRLELMTANDIFARQQAELDLAELLQEAVASLDYRAQQILARRFFADRPETLDEIGFELGVTRERVRQIESKARSEMTQLIESATTLGAVSATAREIIGIVLPLEDLLDHVPALAGQVTAVGQPAWRVLDRLDDAYEIKDGWCAALTLVSAQTETQTRLQEHVNRHGVAAISDLSPLNQTQSVESAKTSLREWLLYCGYEIDGDWVFTRVNSVGDRAAAILSVTGAPMTPQEILDRLGVERSLVSLKNAMASDERFERVDRDKWALSEWGLETYVGIRALVREEVARNGGEIAMDTLIQRIAGKYSVSANSVIAYASSPPFESKSGIVRFATSDRTARKAPSRTRRFYRRTDAWLYRVTVTKEHLRGSGSPAPVALATILNLQHGQTRQLASQLGPQAVTWTGNQPAFGTIRRFLVDRDIEIGSEIFLIIDDDGSFGIEPVNVSNVDPLEHALFLVGATDAAASEQPRLALARAIGLPDESPAASVIGGYRERGDTDIADLLLSVRGQLEEPPDVTPASQPGDIDEILDLL